MRILLKLAKNSLKSEIKALFHMKSTVSLKYFVDDCSFSVYLETFSSIAQAKSSSSFSKTHA